MSLTDELDGSKVLLNEQIDQYKRDGFTVVRDAVDQKTVEDLLKTLALYPPLDGHVPNKYPGPGRYTLATQSLAYPGLAIIAEHPTIVECAKTLLNDDPVLTAFVMYDRTPGGPPIPKHNDYKRWRPVGSSMNWLFAIVPLDDFDEAHGQLFVAPGSHRLERISDTGERVLQVEPAITPTDDSFVDPELQRGDLLLMNMHCWHRAAGNTSTEHRRGFFNKYAGRQFPPATGYYQYSDAALQAISPENRSLIACHSDLPMKQTRLLLQRGDRFLTIDSELPVGSTFHEQAIPDWDLGNFIASAHSTAREILKVETPWLTYVQDMDDGDTLSRVYAYELNELGFPVPYAGDWLTRGEIEDRHNGRSETLDAIELWLDPKIVRGKGVSQAQARIDQYAF